MPHGSVSIGDTTITALCDDVREGPWSLEEAFPDVSTDEWPEVERDHPETVAPRRMWSAHDHCYLIRARDRTMLVDTGIGPQGTPVADLLHPEGGALLSELDAIGVEYSFELFDAGHMAIEYRYPTSLAFLARALAA